MVDCKGDLLVVDYEGGLVGGGLRPLLFASRSFCAFFTSFLCSFNLVLSNLPVSPV